MPRDHLAEIALLDLSRTQREALERWMRICSDIGETVVAEECRRATATKDMREVANAA